MQFLQDPLTTLAGIDIHLPVLDGIEVLKQIRTFEGGPVREYASGPTTSSSTSSASSSPPLAEPREPVLRAVIIAVTGDYRPSALQRVRDAGFDRIMTQPLLPSDVAAILFSGPLRNDVCLHGGVDAATLAKAGYPLQNNLHEFSKLGEKEVK